jgi:hypothetical protein
MAYMYLPPRAQFGPTFKFLIFRFLLATLYLDALKGKRTPGDIRDTLEILPKGSNALQEAYNSIVERIER